jgi:RHS repeat-associated protein
VIDLNLSITRYQYNKNNQKTLETRPLGQTLAYDFNSLGQPKTYTDSLGQVTKYGYDDNGRHITTAYYANAQIATPDKTTSFSYDNAGWLIGYSSGQNSATYTYDDDGRLLSESTNFGSFNKTISYTYYKNGRRHTYKNSENYTYTYQYDQANRFASLVLPDNSHISVNEYQWNTPTKVTYPGGTQLQRQLDGIGQLKNLNVLDIAKNNILDHEYSYDQVGNIKTQKTYFDSFTYDYDDVYRLVNAAGELAQEAYTYDAAGNRLTSDKNNDSWEYNANNQLTNIGDSGYLYDDNGSMTQRTLEDITQKFVYGLDGRLDQVSNLAVSDAEGEASIETTIATYSYDPFGRRLSKTVSGVTTYFLYGTQGLIAEYDEQGQPIRNYNYWPDSHWGSNPLYLVQTTDGESKHYFYHNDHLGTPQLLSDYQGRVVWRAEYTAFGETTSYINEIDNPLRFPGQYSDGETELSYNYFRDYDPQLGRYIQGDPRGITLDFSDPQRVLAENLGVEVISGDTFGLNHLYGYANQNPVLNADPTGEWMAVASKIIHFVHCISNCLPPDTETLCDLAVGGATCSVICVLKRYNPKKGK